MLTPQARPARGLHGEGHQLVVLRTRLSFQSQHTFETYSELAYGRGHNLPAVINE